MPRTSFDWCVIWLAADPSEPWLLVLPQETVSDDEFLITRWLVASGDTVAVGDPVVEVETSKSTVELAVERPGTIHYLHSAGSRVRLGRPVALVTSGPVATTDVEVALGIESGATSAADGAPRFSAAARAALAGTGLSESDFDGSGLVTEAMVARAVAERGAGSRAVPAPLLARADGSALVIVGGGGHAAIVIDVIRALHAFRIVGLLDDALAVGDDVSGVPVLGPVSELAALRERGVVLAVNAIAGLRDRSVRETVWNRITDAGFGLPTLVHPSAVIEASATIAEGAHILAGAYVGARAHVSEDAIVNAHAVVSHDCRIGEHAHIAPSATLAGEVVVGRNALVGMGATVFLGVDIGQEATVGNGGTVMADVPDRGNVRGGA